MTTSPRVRTGRLSNAATALMIVLGIFTLGFVNAIAGAAVLALGFAMYFFGVWLRRKRKEADAGGKEAAATTTAIPSVPP